MNPSSKPDRGVAWARLRAALFSGAFLAAVATVSFGSPSQSASGSPVHIPAFQTAENFARTHRPFSTAINWLIPATIFGTPMIDVGLFNRGPINPCQYPITIADFPEHMPIITQPQTIAQTTP
ncbi:hypothetical protein BH09SUM1_BH09SUM1_29940 [soil metagenome]